MKLYVSFKEGQEHEVDNKILNDKTLAVVAGKNSVDIVLNIKKLFGNNFRGFYFKSELNKKEIDQLQIVSI